MNRYTIEYNENYDYHYIADKENELTELHNDLSKYCEVLNKLDRAEEVIKKAASRKCGPFVDSAVNNYLYGEAKIEMKHFKSVDWFKIAGRGNVCTVTFEEPFFASEVLHQTVLIDDKEYYVNGIESTSLNMIYKAQYIPGRPLALLIRGER